MGKRAVILAAGKSSKFFPPLYDRPKGLFEYRGEVLIERQIRQLLEAGVDDVTVVIGYEKERFFYLEEEFGVSLRVSTRYNDESNLSSLDLVRDKLGGCLLCCADHWYEENPFLIGEPERSIRLVERLDDAGSELVVEQGEDGRLGSLSNGAPSGLCMVGFAYVSPGFAREFYRLYDAERGYVGVKGMLWEQFWGRHVDELPLYGAPAPAGFREFDSLADFADDAGMLANVSQEAVRNICGQLSCEPSEIRDIAPLNKGLTNASFSLTVRGRKYVYRHPGASSSNMVVREAEVVAQNAAIDLGVDYSVIAISEQGWKLSRYVESSRAFSCHDPRDLAAGIAQIRAFHESGAVCSHEVDLLAEGDRLLALAASKKGDLAARYAGLHGDLVRLWHLVELDEVPKVLCHNDTYAVNWIVGDEGQCLIDWEYAGMNDPFNDLATLVVRDGLTLEEGDAAIEAYLGRAPGDGERRHAYGVFALSGWYWFCWSLFKDTLGEDGFFMLPSWRGVNRYLPLALGMYEGRGGK